MVSLRLPQITGFTEREQLVQVKSYLYQLVQELNAALGEAEQVTGEAISSVSRAVQESAGTPEARFAEMKGLIIKSADIVNAYYETISQRLEGVYVAESEFGTYRNEVSAQFTATAESITQSYENLSAVLTELEMDVARIDVSAYVRTGLLDTEDGMPIYGLEVGQRTTQDGEEAFHAYARFTASKLSFYDQNDTEVAYVSNRKLYITAAQITESMQIGGFVDAVYDGGVVTKWVG